MSIVRSIQILLTAILVIGVLITSSRAQSPVGSKPLPSASDFELRGDQLRGSTGIAIFSKSGLKTVNKVRIIVQDFANDEARMGLTPAVIKEIITKRVMSKDSGIIVTTDTSAPILYVKTAIILNIASDGKTPLGTVGTLFLSLGKQQKVPSAGDSKVDCETFVEYFSTDTTFSLAYDDSLEIGKYLAIMGDMFKESVSLARTQNVSDLKAKNASTFGSTSATFAPIKTSSVKSKPAQQTQKREKP